MYNDIIVNNFSSPRHIGELDNPDLTLEIGNPVCGDTIKLHFSLADREIKTAVFRAWGCATSIAAANIFCASVENQNIDELQKRSKSEIDEMLGELDPSQYHCLDILHTLHQDLTHELTLRKAG